MKLPRPHAGVPSPYAFVQHAFPTRYHGPGFRRPATNALPYVISPQSVLRPRDFLNARGHTLGAPMHGMWDSGSWFDKAMPVALVGIGAVIVIGVGVTVIQDY